MVMILEAEVKVGMSVRMVCCIEVSSRINIFNPGEKLVEIQAVRKEAKQADAQERWNILPCRETH